MRSRWLGLVALTLGVAMIIVDATILNVAIPSIIRDLGIGITQAEWANSIYSLVFASLLISVGRLGDVAGRRLVFLAGLVVFAAASVLTARASSGTILLTGRLLQGVGGALILPSTLSIVNATFRGRDRAVAFGIWGSVIGGMAALGPLVGGWFTTNLSWRWAFYINLPIAAVAFAGALVFLGESRDPDARRGVDLPGVLLSTVGFAGVVFGLIEGQTYGWWAAKQPFLSVTLGGVSVVPLAFAVGVAALAAFWAVERRRARRGRPVLVDLTLFRIASFRNGSIAVTIVGLGELGLVFVIPLFLQSVLGLSAFDTGVILVALAGGAFLAGGLAAALTNRCGARRVVQLGLALEVVGIVAVGLTFAPDRAAWQFCPQLFLYGLGVGLATAQLTSVILADVPAAQSGEASGIQSTARQVGAALGIAILGTALTVGLVNGTRSRLERTQSLPPAAVARVADAVERTGGAVLPELRRSPGLAAAVAPTEDAFAAAARRAAFVAAGFVLLGLV
ncbi:MAG TPA: DHA2 family efflux MFS transporter permease subunit, partial [Gaiellaceae bacterium]|nr:DHA2 family efflux MFS transporter permease subunit [Gaiellaceae bacterium]